LRTNPTARSARAEVDRGVVAISDEAAFTLVELLVVVLILGILIAIAIPTFLALTGSAKTNAAEADLTTAVQDEDAYLATSANFDARTATPPPTAGFTLGNWSYDNKVAMLASDPGINWAAAAAPPAGSAGTKVVSIDVISNSAGAAAQLVLGTVGADGNMYWIQDTGGTLLYLRTNALTAQPDPTSFLATNTSWKALAPATSASSPSSVSPSSVTPTTIANGGTTATTTPSSASTTTATTTANNGVTTTPSVSASPYYGTETLSLTNSSAMTALSITINVLQTTGVNGAGQFVTIGNGAMNDSYTSDGTTIHYTFTQVAGSSIVAGSYQAAAQFSGTGAVRVTTGDTWSVTSTTPSGTSTQSGTF
jgi:prepilin-type N-terminal cleavage/methylation domain-containing protein